MHSWNGLDRPRCSPRNRRKPITGRPDGRTHRRTDGPTHRTPRQTDGHRTRRQYPSCQFGWGVKSKHGLKFHPSGADGSIIGNLHISMILKSKRTKNAEINT
jgi:hypothetical protein